MSPATLVDAIPPLDHDEAMTLAEAEISRLLALVDDLDTDEWPRPTDCTGWTVRDMLGHLLAAPRGHLPGRGPEPVPAATAAGRRRPGAGGRDGEQLRILRRDSRGSLVFRLSGAQTTIDFPPDTDREFVTTLSC